MALQFRQSHRSLRDMNKAVWAVLFHIVSTNDKSNCRFDWLVQKFGVNIGKSWFLEEKYSHSRSLPLAIMQKLKLNPWHYSPKEPRMTEAVAAR